MSLEFDPEAGEHVFRATATPSEAVIRHWGLITGDAVHNLRCAVDHLVWQLACYKTGGAGLPGVSKREARRVQFPIDDAPPALDDPQSFHEHDQLKHILPEHRALIHEHQPFGSRFDFSHGQMHHFIRLQELSNHDKHRVVTPVLVIPHRFTDYRVNFEEAGAEAVEWHSIADWPDWLQEPNLEIMRVKIRPSSLQLNMEVAGYVAPHVSFRDYKSDGRTSEADVTIILDQIIVQTEQLIREFEQAF
jgi:hypothetical protein